MQDLQIKTNYNEKLIKKYMIDHFFIRTKKVKIIINIIIVICTILTIILMTNKITTFNIVCLIIYILGFIEFNTSILPKFSFNKLKKSSKLSINTNNEYILSNKEIEIKNNIGSSKINYLDIYQCVEVKNAYYIYLSDRQAFIIDKEQLTKEENQKLVKILTTKIKNYQKINK